MNETAAADAATTQTTAQPAAAAAEQAPQQSGGFSPMILMLVVFVVMIFFMMRSQKKQQKKREEALNTMVKGCKVRTAGGIYGTIVEVKPESFILEVAPGVKMEFARASIAEAISAVPAAAEEKKEEAK